MENSFDNQEDDRNDPLPRDPDEIEGYELFSALRGLAVLDEDAYLRTQALNVSMVDKWLMGLEKRVRNSRFAEDERDHESELFLGALSQMWLFAIYELLRTWRERAKDIQKWAANGGLPLKIASLEKERGYPHLAQEAFIGLLKLVSADSAILARIADDLARTHVLFGQLEFLRVALAKHQVSGKEKQLARAPGVGRVDMWTGSMSYELSKGRIILGELKRRDVADRLRSLAVDRTVPSPEDMKSFDEFMKLSPNFDPFGDSQHGDG
ncbi:MAG: hypothetical protein AB7U61_04615 [Methylocystis sp.]